MENYTLCLLLWCFILLTNWGKNSGNRKLLKRPNLPPLCFIGEYVQRGFSWTETDTDTVVHMDYYLLWMCARTDGLLTSSIPHESKGFFACKYGLHSDIILYLRFYRLYNTIILKSLVYSRIIDNRIKIIVTEYVLWLIVSSYSSHSPHCKTCLKNYCLGVTLNKTG